MRREKKPLASFSSSLSALPGRPVQVEVKAPASEAPWLSHVPMEPPGDRELRTCLLCSPRFLRSPHTFSSKALPGPPLQSTDMTPDGGEDPPLTLLAAEGAPAAQLRAPSGGPRSAPAPLPATSPPPARSDPPVPMPCQRRGQPSPRAFHPAIAHLEPLFPTMPASVLILIMARQLPKGPPGPEVIHSSLWSPLPE